MTVSRKMRRRPHQGEATTHNIVLWWRDPNKILAIATIALVFIGLGALWISRDSEKRQLRAYVFAKPGFVSDVIVGHIPSVTLVTKNSGQTPAYHVQLTGGLYPSSFPLPPNAIPGDGPVNKSPEASLNPGTEDSVGEPNKPMERAITESEVRAIRDGQHRRIYAYGVIQYEDAFGARHFSRYCFAFFGSGPLLTDWNYCNQFENTDDG